MGGFDARPRRGDTRDNQAGAAIRKNMGPDMHIDGKLVPSGHYVVYPFSNVHLHTYYRNQDQIKLFHSRTITYSDRCVAGGKNRQRYHDGVALSGRPY